MRRLFNWLGSSTVFQSDLGLFALRVWLGLVLALGHGIDKVSSFERFNLSVEKLGLPMPYVLGTAAALAEFLGGFLLAAGALTRAAAAAIATTMLVAALQVHGGDPFARQELPLVYGVAAIALALAGPGRLSVDHLLFRARPNA
jgi:putative oxidoreductase